MTKHRDPQKETREATREHEARSAEERDWAPPGLLPDVPPQDGWVFKWCRWGTAGSVDRMNMSKRLREGWVPVTVEEYPHLQDMIPIQDIDSRWTNTGNIEYGGLVLCKMTERMANQRKEYYEKRSKDQRRAVDQRFREASDPRLPLEVIEKRSVQFGSGGGPKAS